MVFHYTDVPLVNECIIYAHFQYFALLNTATINISVRVFLHSCLSSFLKQKWNSEFKDMKHF